MPSVDLSPARTSAAAPSNPVANPRPATGAGFAEAFAEAQAPTASDDEVASEAGGGTAGATPPADPGRRDARLAPWLALAWMTAPQNPPTGQAAARKPSPGDPDWVDETDEVGDGDLPTAAAVATGLVVAVPATAANQAPPQAGGAGTSPHGTDTVTAETKTDAAGAGMSQLSSDGTGAGPAGQVAQQDAGDVAGLLATAGAAGSASQGGPSTDRHAGDGGGGAAPDPPAEKLAPQLRNAAFARAIADKFQPVEANPSTGPSPQPRSWVDTVEPVLPKRSAAREYAVAMAAVPAAMSAPGASVAAAAAVQAPAATVPLDGEAAEALHSQIIQTMRLQHQGSGGDARIRLQPHYLGELTISLRVEQGAVTAHLTAAHPDVRQWIEANEAMLRQHLAQHDLSLDRLTVAEEEAAELQRNRDEGETRREAPPKPRRRRPDTDATFEVVV